MFAWREAPSSAMTMTPGAATRTHVAFVTDGHSEFNDAIWAWLGTHAPSWAGEPDVLSGWNYALMWPLLIVAGCEVDVDHTPFTTVTFWYRGSISDLIKRLDAVVGE